MVRETSREAYREITENGLLSAQRLQIYKALYEFGPCTAGELFMFMEQHQVKGSVCARLTELRDQGVARELTTRECSFSKKTAIVWDVTSKLPNGNKKKPKRNWYLVITVNGWTHLFDRRIEAEAFLAKEEFNGELLKVKEI